MGVSVSTTATDISVSVNDQSISASVGGGIGPQGPAGAASTSAAGVSTLNGLTGTLTIKAGSNVTVTTGTAGLTISGSSGGASSWNDIADKPNLVYSVAGRTGTVTLTTSDIGGYVAPAVSSVAGRTGAVTLSTSDISGYTASAVTSVAGRTGAVTLSTSDISGFTAAAASVAPVQSVAGRTGAVTLTTSDVGGYVAPAVSSVAGRTGAITLTSADIGGNLVSSVNGITGTPAIVAGTNVTVTTASSSITVAAGSYSLPPATTSTLGGVIVGSGLSVDGSGNLAVNERLLTALSSSSTSATTAETSVASVSLTAVANDVIRGRVVASVTNNSGASCTYTWRVKLGATTLLTLSNALAANSSARTLIIDFAVNVISTTSQVAGAWMAIGFNNLGATISTASGTATETVSSAKTLDMTFQMSASTGTPSAPQFTFLSAIVERSKG